MIEIHILTGIISMIPMDSTKETMQMRWGKIIAMNTYELRKQPYLLKTIQQLRQAFTHLVLSP